MKLLMASSKPKHYNDIYQPGGVTLGVDGQRSGCVISPKLQLPIQAYGRWALTHLNGKKHSILTLITIYCSGDSRDIENIYNSATTA